MSDDLFDEPIKSAPKRRGRKPKPKPEVPSFTASIKSARGGKTLDDVGGLQAMRRPVPANTLAVLFDLNIVTVKKRLTDCPCIKDGNFTLYDFREACSYLVKPKMSTAQFIKTLNKSNLPPEINLAFWSAQRARIKFMIEAQEAWDTQDVLDVLTGLFSMMKDHLQMAEEDLRERAKLTDEQAKIVSTYMDDLRRTLREKLVQMPSERQTLSMSEKASFGTESLTDNVLDEDDVFD